MEKQTFRKTEKVTNRSRYRAIYQLGEWRASKNFTAVICSNYKGTKRLGITVTKKTGSAVRRNRIKRLMREYFRLNKNLFPADHDIILMSRKNMPFLSYSEVCKELTAFFTRKSGT